MAASNPHAPKFTPGPWFQNEQNPFQIVDAQGAPIATTQFNPDEHITSREEMTANACLVATAPELYEALTELLKMAEIQKTANQFPLWKAHKILAKARGR